MEQNTNINITEIPFEIVELDGCQNVHPIVEAYIENQLLRLVIDTGASHSCLSKKAVKHLIGKTDIKADAVVGIGRRLFNNKFARVPIFRIGDLEIRDYSFLSLQINHINKMLSSLGLGTIDGLLGSDILYTYKAVIDYNAKKITFLH